MWVSELFQGTRQAFTKYTLDADELTCRFAPHKKRQEEYFLVSAKPGQDHGTNDLLHVFEMNYIHLSLLRAEVPAR